eukprot:g2104.t1
MAKFAKNSVSKISPSTHVEKGGTTVKTSQTHPMNVSWVMKSNTGGRVGLTFCPGKKVCRGGVYWCRNLDADLTRLKTDFGVTTVVCLLSQAELTSLNLRNYAADVQSKGLKVHSFPIVDMSAPDSLNKTVDFVDLIKTKLADGEVIIIHCRGGVGRAGLIASCLLLRLNLATSPNDAIAKIRKLRCRTAVESYCQERFIAHYAHFIRNEKKPKSHEHSVQEIIEGSMITWEVFQKKTLWEHTLFAKNEKSETPLLCL